MRLDYLVRSFAAAARVPLTAADRRLAQTSGKLDALSPLKVLSRGYAIGYRGNEVLKRASDAREGEQLALRYADGQVECRVDRVTLSPAQENQSEPEDR